MKPIKEMICQRLHILLGAFLLVVTVAADATGNSDNNYCTIQELVNQHPRSDTKISPDYSCLVSLPELAEALTAYQLVDARSEPVPPLPGAWNIPVPELRHKSFLKSRKLLVVKDNFGLYEKAYECARLRREGFAVKFLVGSGWWFGDSPDPEREVSAKEVYREYLHGKVILVASSSAVSRKLKSIGMGKHFTVATAKQKEIEELALEHTENGLVPVVLVGDYQKTLRVSKFGLPNIYSIDGGVNTLGIYYRDMKLAFAGKRDRESRRVCGQI